MPDLLARRRLETSEVIHRAALDLFEQHGVRGTTVPQIAVRAGVSHRTFFRYFRAKEEAAMPGRHRLLAAVDAIGFAGRSPARILAAVADAVEGVIRDETDDGLIEHGRISRLLVREPELQWYAAARDREFGAHVTARVQTEAPEIDALTAALLSEIVVTLWRVTWNEWGAQAEHGDALVPPVVYARLRAALPALI